VADSPKLDAPFEAQFHAGRMQEWVIQRLIRQIHTADLPGADRAIGHRAGLAVEPMTCAPGALDEDLLGYEAGLVTLEPGAVHEASWTIAAA